MFDCVYSIGLDGLNPSFKFASGSFILVLFALSVKTDLRVVVKSS